MKKMLLFLVFCYSTSLLCAQVNKNVDIFGQFDRGDNRYSGSWAYVAPNGAEYALLGTSAGLAIYGIDEAMAIEELDFIPGPVSNWREITVIGQHAYVTTEGSGSGTGMQVVDLSSLPDSVSLVTTYTQTFTRGHIIQRDIYSEAPYVYISGTNSTSGIHILDVSDPANPTEVGLYNPGYYIHDCHVNGDLLFAAAFYEGKIDVVNIQDKSNPVKVVDFEDRNGNTHSSWLTEDKKFLFLASELDGTPGRVYNIEDLNDIYAVNTYTANISSLVHNPYVRGDYAFISHNTEGLRVVDIADPKLPVEVGYYDTFVGASGGFNGLWSACPYYPSGKIIGGNREDGLYVWTFNNAKAGRVYGRVEDAFSGSPIGNAEIVVEGQGDTLTSLLDGTFAYGELPGNFTFKASAVGYASASVSLDIEAGDQQEVIIKLDQTVGTQVEPVLEALSFQPNPCTLSCRLELAGNPAIHQVDIFDGRGRSLWSYTRTKAAPYVDFSSVGFPAGLYFFQLSNSQGSLLQRGKLIIP